MQPHLALRPSQALLQPKQGRCSNLLRVGSSSRSRVSLIRLPSLIIPREVVGAASLAPALRAPLPAPRVSRCMALPVPCQGLCPKAPRAVIPGSYICSRLEEERFWGGQRLGRDSNTIKRETKDCSIARCQRLISLLLQIIRSCDCLIDDMIV